MSDMRDDKYDNGIDLIDKMEVQISRWFAQPLDQTTFSQIFSADAFPSFRKGNAADSYCSYELRKGQGLSGDLECRYDGSRRSVSFRLRLSLNGNRLLRRKYLPGSSDVARKQSYDGQDNWLPASTIQEHRDRIQSDLANEISAVISQIMTEISDAVQNNMLGDTVTLNEPQIAVLKVEICHDIDSPNPLFLVQSLKTRFSQFLKRSQVTKYPVLLKEETDSNSLCLKGYHRKGEDYKVYSKAEGLVRFETTFSNPRISDLCNSSVLKSPLESSILQMIITLGRQARGFAMKMKGKRSRKERLSQSVDEYELAKVCKSRDEYKRVSEMIKTNGRICSNRGLYKFIERACKKGVLEKAGRGIYIPGWRLRVGGA